MINVAIEAPSKTARFAVGAQAPTNQQTLNITATRYPGNAVWVKPPIYREGSYVETSAA